MLKSILSVCKTGLMKLVWFLCLLLGFFIQISAKPISSGNCSEDDKPKLLECYQKYFNSMDLQIDEHGFPNSKKILAALRAKANKEGGAESCPHQHELVHCVNGPAKPCNNVPSLTSIGKINESIAYAYLWLLPAVSYICTETKEYQENTTGVIKFLEEHMNCLLLNFVGLVKVSTPAELKKEFTCEQMKETVGNCAADASDAKIQKQHKCVYSTLFFDAVRDNYVKLETCKYECDNSREIVDKLITETVA